MTFCFLTATSVTRTLRCGLSSGRFSLLTYQSRPLPLSVFRQGHLRSTAAALRGSRARSRCTAACCLSIAKFALLLFTDPVVGYHWNRDGFFKISSMCSFLKKKSNVEFAQPRSRVARFSQTSDASSAACGAPSVNRPSHLRARCGVKLKALTADVILP